MSDYDKLRDGEPLDIPIGLCAVEVPEKLMRRDWRAPRVAVLSVAQATALRDWLNGILSPHESIGAPLSPLDTPAILPAISEAAAELYAIWARARTATGRLLQHLGALVDIERIADPIEPDEALRERITAAVIKQMENFRR